METQKIVATKNNFKKNDPQIPYASPDGDPGKCPLMPKISTVPLKIVESFYMSVLE